MVKKEDQGPKCGAAHAATAESAGKKSPSGPKAIMLLLQGYPANTVNPDDLVSPFAEVVRSIIANGRVERMKAFQISMAALPRTDAAKVFKAVMATARRMALAEKKKRQSS